jgi:hypothetical protein
MLNVSEGTLLLASKKIISALFFISITSILALVNGCGRSTKMAVSDLGAEIQKSLADADTVRNKIKLSYLTSNPTLTDFQGQITIQNSGATLNNWRLQFDYVPGITSISNAIIKSSHGTHYNIRGTNDDSDVPARGSVVFQFRTASADTSQFPTGCLLNGVACSFDSLPGPNPTVLPSPVPTGSGTVLSDVYITFYGFDDNDDGNGHYGNAVISDPIIHKVATEDTGTYDHPSTFAADEKYRFAKAGTLIYVPKLRKYYIMEDTCRQCTTDENNGKTHVDLYMGGNTKLQGQPLLVCENTLTAKAFTDTIVVNPGSDWPVDTVPLFSNGVCNSQLFPVPPLPSPTPTITPTVTPKPTPTTTVTPTPAPTTGWGGTHIPFTLSGGMTALQSDAILSLVSIAENGNTSWWDHYTYIEDIKDGRGYTINIVGFCTGTSDFLWLVNDLKAFNPKHPLVLNYLTSLQKVDGTATHPVSAVTGKDDLPAYVATLGNDADYLRATWDAINHFYWQPSMDTANQYGLTSPISKGQLYDIALNYGDTSLAAKVKSTPPSKGGDEKVWLAELQNIWQTMITIGDKTLDSGQPDRALMWKSILRKGNVNLDRPMTGLSCYGDTFSIN